MQARNSARLKPSPILGCLLSLGLAGAAHARSYAVADLGGFWPTAVNNAGQVVGEGALWQSGELTPLPLHATAINTQGQIVGFRGSGIVSAMTEHNVHAYLWQARKLTDLGTPSRASQARAYGISNTGQIVGSSYWAPLLWESGQKIYLPPLVKNPRFTVLRCEALGLNDAGLIVGYGSTSRGEHQPVVWQNRRLSRLSLPPGCRDGEAVAVNARGLVAGSCSLRRYGRPRRACVWENRRPRALGAIPGDTASEARAVNAQGQVVGFAGAEVRKRWRTRAVLWQNGHPSDLNALLPRRSGWVLESASGISDRGQIVGYGRHNGRPRAFLLTPRQ